MNPTPVISKTLLARNTIFNLVGQVFPLLIGLVTIPFVVAKLGSDRFGLLSLLWSLLGYFTIFDVGLGRATTKFVAEELGKGGQNNLPKIVWTAVVIQTFFGICGTAIVVAFIPLLVEHVLTIPEYLREEAMQIFYLFPFLIPVVLVSGSFRGVLEATQRFDAANVVKIVFGSLTFLIPAFGVSVGMNLVGIVVLLMLGSFGTFVSLLILNLRLTPQLRKIAFERSLIRVLFSFGGWVMVSSFAAPLLMYFERFVIASSLSIGLLTYYVIPFEMISRLIILPASLAVTLFPAFSYVGVENKTRVQQLVSRPVKYLMLSLGPLILIFTIYAEEILSLWLGAEFTSQGKTVFQILTLAFLFHAFAYIPFSAVHGFGRPDLKAKFDIVILLVFAGLCLWLVPAFGIIGAAVAKGIITIADLLFLSLTLKRLSGLTVRELFGDRIERGAAALVLFGAVIIVVSELSASLLVNGLALLGVATIYIFVLLSYVMDEKDKELARTMLTRWHLGANET
ncbi:MAG: flippase [Ignavibacteriae bacterium]|nr:flippase [Ignavibacteriota bacterium]